MDPARVVIWAFLAIFTLTALIDLGALVGWVKIEPFYKRNLFKLVIVEVVTCVAGFGIQAFKSIAPARVDLKATLLSRPQYGWDAQYAEKHWRTQFYFSSAGNGKITMVGDTYLVDAAGGKRKIISWTTPQPFDVPANAESVTFAAQRAYTAEAAQADPQMQWEVGKKVDVEITFRPEMALEGSSKTASGTETWGMVLTPAYP